MSVRFAMGLFFGWVLLLAAPRTVSSSRLRAALSRTLPALFIAGILTFSSANAWQRLFLSTVCLLYVLKTSILLRLPRYQTTALPILGHLVYMSIWPGMKPDPFHKRMDCDEPGSRFVSGYIRAVIGVLLIAGVSLASPYLGAVATGWLGIAAVLLTVHFGYADMLTSGMRLAGWDVQPLFDRPLESRTIREFWGRRWNRAFVEMDKLLFLPSLSRMLSPAAAVIVVFLTSGLLHDLAISLPVNHGWGRPTLYFAIQGLAFVAERKLAIRGKHRMLAIGWAWAIILIPMPLLFHRAFREGLVVPFFGALNSLLVRHGLDWYLGCALWLAAAGNFLALVAGVQVPSRLNWKEELSRLSPFNRKIMLNYYGYVGLMLISFGVLTILLHNEMLKGDRAAVYLAATIGLFWGARILVDYFWFGRKGWPRGPQFVIGHALLNSLFAALTVSYLGLVLRHLFG